MRIGNDDNYLSIESIALEGGYTSLRFDAVARAWRCKFTASHDGIMPDSSDETISRFADFESLKSEHIEIELTEDGWLRLHRDARGCLTVRYRIGSVMASATMEGEILVDGEFAGSFCREFRTLVFPRHFGK